MNLALESLVGGMIIGLAISALLFLNGRVAGVSGIVSGALGRNKGDRAWRVAFVLGLISGGFFLRALRPEVFTDELSRGPWVLGLAGLLVGYGTALGSGCTSGHGICGVSRFSKRSLVATAVFMLFGILTATAFRVLTGGI